LTIQIFWRKSTGIASPLKILGFETILSPGDITLVSLQSTLFFRIAPTFAQYQPTPKKNNDYFVTRYLPPPPKKSIDYFVGRYCPLKKSND
jgi:hypothetical protein